MQVKTNLAGINLNSEAGLKGEYQDDTNNGVVRSMNSAVKKQN
ncbi:hypothetical protein PTD2_21832 [Pseudoalteromonas tunicata D2]|uniref:Uncharacterized protein n=1 Tax=Pseudoalteromonas tunicata D2 TaxID=87626 RepID=A4CAU2_9GAMM|nr:hypothetical protein PTD2_21832 [Pseudoalteromonas tunicata D2]